MSEFKVQGGKVTNQDALEFASQLEEAIGKIANGEMKSNKLPIEPIIKLIQFARDQCAEE